MAPHTNWNKLLNTSTIKYNNITQHGAKPKRPSMMWLHTHFKSLVPIIITANENLPRNLPPSVEYFGPGKYTHSKYIIINVLRQQATWKKKK